MSSFAARLNRLFCAGVLALAVGCMGPLTEPYHEPQPWPPAGQAAQDIVLLDFTATWCAPCQRMKPTIHSLQNAGYPIRAVDVDQEPDLAKKFEIQTLPTFVLVVDGQEAARVRGVASQTQLERMFREQSQRE